MRIVISQNGKKKLKLSKSDWLSIGENNNWLERTAQTNTPTNISLKRFYDYGIILDNEEKKQLLRAFDKRKQVDFISEIKELNPQDYPLISSFAPKFLSRIHDIIKRVSYEEAQNAIAN